MRIYIHLFSDRRRECNYFQTKSQSTQLHTTIMAFNKTVAVALAALLMAASISAQLNPLNAAETTPTPEAGRKTTTTVTTSTSSTTTTSTTEVPTTSSSTTTTTTTPATTSSTSTTTTTAAPIDPTTTTVKPSPAPPAPMPAPQLNRWTFSENNVTCLIVQMAAQLNVTYEATDNTPRTALYNFPSNNHTVGGSCTNTTDRLIVDLGNDNRLQLLFAYADNDTQHYQLAELLLQINGTQFADAKANQTIRLRSAGPQFSTHVQNSYHCTRVQQLNLTAADAPVNATDAPAAHVDVSRLQFEAFHRTHDDHFSTARDCDAVDTPDIVPIAVGCALVALVVLMLIAYLCARRRQQTHGYLSM